MRPIFHRGPSIAIIILPPQKPILIVVHISLSIILFPAEVRRSRSFPGHPLYPAAYEILPVL